MRDANSESASSPRQPRAALHDTPINFKAHGPLVEVAKKLATARGMSLAELMRHALRRELDVANGGVAGDAGKLSAMDTQVRRAAKGDVDAQRQEILNALIGAQGDPRVRYECLRLAEHWARMAALTGGDVDHARLVSILALRVSDSKERGDIEGAHLLEAESIAIVSVLADEGNEDCATALSAFSGSTDANVMAQAQAYVASWKAAV